ncbi:hypothetical protein LNQ03_03350 [Klebsiella pneumoniae subsp. pneumoniae]|nr:hypothetical protein [Klebsiella pneumoniae subsp. pneumoniae]
MAEVRRWLATAGDFEGTEGVTRRKSPAGLQERQLEPECLASSLLPAARWRSSCPAAAGAAAVERGRLAQGWRRWRRRLRWALERAHKPFAGLAWR